METKEIKLSQISKNEENPRLITEENFAKLEKSLLVFPRMLTLRPVVVDETLRVLGGNMRLKALQRIAKMSEGEMRKRISEDERVSAEMCEALIEYWKDWKKNQMVTVVKADDLTEEQKREFIIKDNAAFGQWDFEKLANEWDDLPLEDWGISGWEDMPEGEEERPEVTEDNYKADHVAPERVKRGEIWQLGNHRLMCGDSTDAEQVKRLTAGNLIHLLVTDPPYNINYQGKGRAKREKIANDNMDADSFVNFLTDAFAAADEVMVEGGCFTFGMPQAKWLIS